MITTGKVWETSDNDLAGFGHLQFSFENGYALSSVMLFLNIFFAVAVRLTGASLPRESDKLVVMWKFRWIPLLNMISFIAGSVIGFIMCLGVVQRHNEQGNACMDGTQTYLGW